MSADLNGLPVVVKNNDGSESQYAIGDGVGAEIFGNNTDGVPCSVTMRQARQALHIAGKLPAVEAAIAAMPEPPRELARIAWDHAQVVGRYDPFLLQLAAALGMSAAEVDALFVQAAAL